MLSSFRKKFVKVISGSDLLPVDTTVHVLLTLALNGAVIKCCRILLGCVTRTTIHKQMILTIVTSYLVPHTNMSNNCSIFRGLLSLKLRLWFSHHKYFVWPFRIHVPNFPGVEWSQIYQRPPGTETPSPGQRPPPLDRDTLPWDRDTLPWTETPSPGQRPPPQIETPLDRYISPLNRESFG